MKVWLFRYCGIVTIDGGGRWELGKRLGSSGYWYLHFFIWDPEHWYWGHACDPWLSYFGCGPLFLLVR